jgi:hypothetical protein
MVHDITAGSITSYVRAYVMFLNQMTTIIWGPACALVPSRPRALALSCALNLSVSIVPMAGMLLYDLDTTEGLARTHPEFAGFEKRDKTRSLGEPRHRELRYTLPA